MEGVKILDTGVPGPTTLIVGLVHGNEIVGEQILNFVNKNYHKIFSLGKVVTMEGNPKAFAKRTRFIDQDLNRSFGECTSNNMETQRATEIKKYFESDKLDIDYIFDFHSTQSDSEPMIICTSDKKSHMLSELFPIKKVVFGLVDSIIGHSLLKYFDTKGVMGIAFECGSHNKKKNINVAKQILNIISNIHNKNLSQIKFQQEKVFIKHLIKTSDSKFRFTRDFSGFEKIKKGEVYAKNSVSDIKAEEDCIMILPNLTNLNKLSTQKYIVAGYLGIQ